MEFWPIWVQKGSQLSFDQPRVQKCYLNGVLTNLSAKGLSQWSFDQSEFWPTWVQKSLLNGVLTNLSAKGLVQWTLTNLSAKGLVQRSYHQFECKKVISMEFWPIWVQMASSIILTNRVQKGHLNGILTNLSAKWFVEEFWPILVQKGLSMEFW